MVYTGNSAYCYSNSLHMCLRHAGMRDLPDVSFIESATGMPFGTCFLNFDTPLFFPSPAQTDPHLGVSQALKTFGWTCELWQGDSAEDAKIELNKAIKRGPVLLGPLDMGFLSYDPNHENKKGGDHYLVVLDITGDMAELHDPQFYPYVTLPIEELMQAWNASAIGYTDMAYTLRFDFCRQEAVSRQEMVSKTLHVAQKFQGDVREGDVVYTGAAAFRKALQLLHESSSSDFSRFLTHFALPVGARRSVDGMYFMMEAGEGELAKLYEQRAKLFGKSQYLAARQRWEDAAEALEALAEVEGRLTDSMPR